MEQTLFFYDLETTGLSGRRDRIMQFAGQQTTLELEPIGDSVNLMVRLDDDILPSPGALLTTGLNPLQMAKEGLPERELAALLQEQIFSPGTIAVGFNTTRFDDEFIRHLFWRNFYDPYTWAWEDERSRWDILDLSRMTRALRPDGIAWPVDDQGKPHNKLGPLAEANGLDHTRAHDAMSDIEVTIAMAQLLKRQQPKLFDYLFSIRDKRAVNQLVSLDQRQPFVYTSGAYGSPYLWTTIAYPVFAGTNSSEIIVYDARYSLAEAAALTPKQIHDALFGNWQLRQDLPRLPFKRLKLNACPAVAPLSTLRDEDWQRLELSKEDIQTNIASLSDHPEILAMIEDAFVSRPEYISGKDVEEQLYDGFLNDVDRRLFPQVRQRDAQSIVDYAPLFNDERLPELLLHYKARNFPGSLNQAEQIAWGNYRHDKLMTRLGVYWKEMSSVPLQTLAPEQQEVMANLQAWAEQILPAGWQETEPTLTEDS